MTSSKPDARDLFLKYLDERATAFANGRLDSPQAEALFKRMESRLSLDTLLKNFGKQIEPQSEWIHRSAAPLSRYIVWRACAGGIVPENLQEQAEISRHGVREQISAIIDTTKKSIRRHLSLIPDPAIFAHIALDDHLPMPTDTEKPVSTETLAPFSDSHYVVVMDRDEKYTITLDNQNTRNGELEIGDDVIRLTLDRPTGITVYFNGIGPDCRRQVHWLSDTVCLIPHEFDHPEFTNLSILGTDHQMTIIVWNAVEKDLIDSIIAQLMPQRDRLAWWGTPRPELHGMTPWQCLRIRREDLVLEWLKNTFHLAELDLKNND